MNPGHRAALATTLLLASSLAGCGRDAPDPALEAQRQDALRRSRVLARRGCESARLALHNDVDAAETQRRSLENSLGVTRGILAAARARPQPDEGIVQSSVAEEQRITRELAQNEARRQTLAGRLSAQESECRALPAP